MVPTGWISRGRSGISFHNQKHWVGEGQTPSIMIFYKVLNCDIICRKQLTKQVPAFHLAVEIYKNCDVNLRDNAVSSHPKELKSSWCRKPGWSTMQGIVENTNLAGMKTEEWKEMLLGLHPKDGEASMVRSDMRQPVPGYLNHGHWLVQEEEMSSNLFFPLESDFWAHLWVTGHLKKKQNCAWFSSHSFLPILPSHQHENIGVLSRTLRI